jgi:hypothetical protein
LIGARELLGRRGGSSHLLNIAPVVYEFAGGSKSFVDIWFFFGGNAYLMRLLLRDAVCSGFLPRDGRNSMEGRRGKLPSGALCLLVVWAGILADAEG